MTAFADTAPIFPVTFCASPAKASPLMASTAIAIDDTLRNVLMEPSS